MPKTPTPPTMLDLLEDLRALNLKAGKSGSDYELANTLGANRGSMSRWLAGSHVPSEMACIPLAKALDLPLEYVLAIRAYSVAQHAQNAEGVQDFKQLAANMAQRFCAVFIGFFVSLEILQSTLPGAF